MPKNRNRIVKNSFEFSSDFLKTLPYPEKVNINSKSNYEASVNQLYLGESISHNEDYHNHNTLGRKLNHSSSSSSSGNIASGVSDVDIISFGKSSSSSISWNEEYGIEATQQVQNEFERMERILQGIEPIPSNYNRDEYEQWIKTFPQLRITGTKMKYPLTQSLDVSENNYEEVIAIDSDLSYLMENCDNDSTSTELSKIDNLKSAVIEQLFENISSKLLQKNSVKKVSERITVSKSKSIANKSDLTSHETPRLDDDFSSFLRVSPVLLQNSMDGSEARQQSSQSVARSEKLASRWMHEEPVEYLSLPCISPSAKMRVRKTNKRKNSAIRQPSQMSSNRSNHVSLPPIVVTNLQSTTNRYRSISATPRQPSKGTSALSVQVDSLIDKRKSRFELSNYLVPNSSNRKSNLLKRSEQM